MSTLGDTSDSTFEQDVLKSQVPVVVDFWAEWCGPCRMITPILEEISKEMGEKVKIVKMNIEENPNVPSERSVRSIPTLLLFKDGKQFSTIVGLQPKSKIIAWINSAI